MPIYHWTDEFTEIVVTTMKTIEHRNDPPSDQEILEAGLDPETVALVRRPVAPNVQRVSFLDGRKREDFAQLRAINQLKNKERDSSSEESRAIKREIETIKQTPVSKFKE